MSTDERASAEQLLLEAVSKDSLQQVVHTVASKDVNVNCVDEHGMSPLQHACYKGNLEIAKFLLDRGADVNQNDHEHSYTALMFAALGGHAALLSLLLEHGANVGALNSVGRNASQMAAFVGQHRSVAIINNFISREYIEYYSKITGLEKQPRLATRFIQPVHALVRLVNINPVRVVYFFKANLSLLDEAKMISTVLDFLCERLLRESSDPKEMLSLKVHYLSFMLQHLHKAILQAKAKESKIESDSFGKANTENILNNLIKFWLKPSAKGFPENMERLLRQSIRQYPYQESSVFQQLVQTLSSVEIGDEPSALSILSQAIMGKSLDGEDSTCFTCGEPNPNKRCSKCKVTTYCDATCQKLHWSVHKHICDELMKQNIQRDNVGAECTQQTLSKENKSPNEC